MNMKNKICMVLCRHSVIDTRIYHKEAKTLRDAGYNIHILGRLDNDGNFYDMGKRTIARPDPNNGIWKYDNITFHGIKKRKGLIGKYREYKEMLDVALSIDADVYHVHESDIALLVGLKIKKIKGNEIKLIYDVHEYWPYNWGSKFKNKQIKYLIEYVVKLYEKYVISFCDFIITVSNPLKGYLQMQNRYKQIEVIYNSPSLSNHVASPFTKESILLCYEGRLRFEEGLITIIELLYKLMNKGVKLFIVGEAKGKEKIYIEKSIKEKGVEGAYIETGWLPYEKVHANIAKADIGLILTDKTKASLVSGPNKLFNYITCGLPIVSVDYPEMRSIIKKYQCGILINKINVETVLSAIEYLMKNPEKAKEMGERGRKAAEIELSWQHQGDKLLKIYQEVINKNKDDLFRAREKSH